MIQRRRAGLRNQTYVRFIVFRILLRLLEHLVHRFRPLLRLRQLLLPKHRFRFLYGDGFGRSRDCRKGKKKWHRSPLIQHVVRTFAKTKEKEGRTQLHAIGTEINPVGGLIAVLTREPVVDGERGSGASRRVDVILEELDLIPLKE
jgi:hypothetical protein